MDPILHELMRDIQLKESRLAVVVCKNKATRDLKNIVDGQVKCHFKNPTKTNASIIWSDLTTELMIFIITIGLGYWSD